MLRTPGSWQLLILWLPIIIPHKIIKSRLQQRNNHECFLVGVALLYLGTGFSTLIGGVLQLSFKDTTFWGIFLVLSIASLILTVSAHSNDSSSQ